MGQSEARFRESRMDERRAERRLVVLPARCRSRSGFVDHVVIADLNEWGCRIESGALILCPGQLVVISPKSLEGLCGEIRWTDGHTAGIAFAQPLYAPVVEHLQRRHARFLGTPQLEPWQVRQALRAA
jgi:hypothetical protein